jgi:S1-C subfamily serine protease
LVTATVVEVDDAHDLALLKVSQNPFVKQFQTRIKEKGKMLPLRVTTAKLNSRLPSEGEELLVSGYPLDMPTFVTQKGMVASESSSVLEVPGAPVGSNRLATFDSILLDAVVNPGNSGGPVYSSESGDVIGICEAYKDSPLLTSKQHAVTASGEILTQNSGLAVVIPIEYAIDLPPKKGSF